MTMGGRNRSDIRAEMDAASVACDTWHDEASCRFSPLYRWYSADTLPADIRQEMKQTCESCPVFAQCSNFAASHGPRSGFWAGRFRGAKIPSDMKDNPRYCPVDSNGAAKTVVLFTAAKEFDGAAVRLKKLFPKECFVDICTPYIQPGVYRSVQVILVDNETIEDCMDMIAVTPNDDVFVVGMEAGMDKIGVEMFGDNYVTGRGKTAMDKIIATMERRGR